MFARLRTEGYLEVKIKEVVIPALGTGVPYRYLCQNENSQKISCSGKVHVMSIAYYGLLKSSLQYWAPQMELVDPITDP